MYSVYLLRTDKLLVPLVLIKIIFYLFVEGKYIFYSHSIKYFFPFSFTILGPVPPPLEPALLQTLWNLDMAVGRATHPFTWTFQELFFLNSLPYF
jgi:hypothetical protein